MKIKALMTGLLALTLSTAYAQQQKDAEYMKSEEYLTLRDSVYHAFNDGDSARFFHSVKSLQNYLLEQDDLHAYYTQRCNEIVFQLNRQRIIEAYKLAIQLSKELTEKQLDKEMYMAINMMGHIYRYSGNTDMAKKCFWDVIHRMEKEGYPESQPPIYMNLVNIMVDENPEEALKLIDKAAEIAGESSPERVFDIETRRALVYYRMGDMKRFQEGYKAYREGVEHGQNSVHGRTMEIYHLASEGKTDEAVKLAAETGDDPYETQADIYSKAGRWHEAYEALKLGYAESDSINSVILSSSMQDIQNELKVYEARQQTVRQRVYALAAIAALLALLVVALVYIVQSRRRHLREMRKAYDKMLESDQMKTSFIQNVSHEVRTPLNVISGYAQVMADPTLDTTPEERKRMADTIMHNTRMVTTMISEVLDMSDSESTTTLALVPLRCNDVLRKVVNEFLRDMLLKAEDVTFETTLSDDFTITSHQHMLQRIVTPLLDNAFKNDPEHHVTLRASKAGKRLVVEVEDKGKGVPAEEAEHIFERFVKLDTFKEGLGLGLTFSRTMARRLGGDVTLDTTYEGPGARFKVVI